MKNLERRIRALKAQQREAQTRPHHLPVVVVPWGLSPAEREAWLAEQRACDCAPDCPGKTVGIVVPAKTPSVEAWAAWAHQWYQGRDAS